VGKGGQSIESFIAAFVPSGPPQRRWWVRRDERRDQTQAPRPPSPTLRGILTLSQFRCLFLLDGRQAVEQASCGRGKGLRQQEELFLQLRTRERALQGTIEAQGQR
jgi:hypothetical protein